ncbi:ExbD/TolR family protein [Simiduia aestuariiviva]|uniref:Biopolymer transport protein ExbD n=1 Tax=Simiduia aestuariiviva TaxID=1510459 RepID=A0A839UPI1_9GAMM|nr:biopolymer transporter ExbD [Simiduia aestuariiviva]MBB3169752.1 biopolymer transport protein ExbD [Simiduia aestuariiviva]
MKQSLRAKRMAKHHKRTKNQSKLNLVSLMDIFTILVFFLLVNSSDVEVLQTDKTITLPTSTAETMPDTTVVVRVNATDVLVGGRPIAKVDAVMAEAGNNIPALAQELKFLSANARPLTPEEQLQGRAVTIMGDKDIPYTLLKKVMATCAENEYRNIALAVSKAASEDAETET